MVALMWRATRLPRPPSPRIRMPKSPSLCLPPAILFHRVSSSQFAIRATHPSLRPYSLSADTDDERSRWITALELVARRKYNHTSHKHSLTQTLSLSPTHTRDASPPSHLNHAPQARTLFLSAVTTLGTSLLTLSISFCLFLSISLSVRYRSCRGQVCGGSCKPSGLAASGAGKLAGILCPQGMVANRTWWWSQRFTPLAGLLAQFHHEFHPGHYPVYINNIRMMN